MHRFLSFFLVTLLLVWLTPTLVLSQPSLQGPQTGTLGPGTFLVVGDIYVPHGQTLTILPGTTFLHTGHFTWYINGLIHAVGNSDSLIQFLRQQPIENHRWGGLRFQAGASNESLIEDCIIDNCKNITTPNYYGGGIYSNGVSFTVRDTKISTCYASYGGGAYITGGAAVEFDHCLVLKNEAGNGAGLYFYGSPNSIVKNSLIARNKSTST